MRRALPFSRAIGLHSPAFCGMMTGGLIHLFPGADLFSANFVNIAERLGAVASRMPDAIAVAEPAGRSSHGQNAYRRMSFRQLDQDSDRIARGLRWWGIKPGTRLALLVPPGIDFVSLVFGLWKAGVVIILIDPGMGRANLLHCLAEAEPDGFVAIPRVQLVRALLRRRFPKARYNVTVGCCRWFWGGKTLTQLRGGPWNGRHMLPTAADDPAAVIFTTGSTGPPKGVLYRHRQFNAQVDQLREHYGIRPGEVDISCFPLFALFNAALGVTAVIPTMDPRRPAEVDPAKIVEAIHDWRATQAFGSPAIWNRVGPYCCQRGIPLSTLRRVLSAGAPVPAHVLETMKSCIAIEGDVFTPYGATEALPVASIGASEVLSETAAQTREGAGVCVGRRFSGIRWKVIRIVDGPIPTLAEAQELPQGEIGELIVSGPVVTRQYVTRVEANALGKIADGSDIWHRMGDVGYLDAAERFWFCGRMTHRVQTPTATLFTIPCEAIFNQLDGVARSALVGIGEPGKQEAVIVLEPKPGRATTDAARAAICEAARELAAKYPHTAEIRRVLVHPAFPVDIRHNAKIFREKLAVWAAEQ